MPSLKRRKQRSRAEIAQAAAKAVEVDPVEDAAAKLAQHRERLRERSIINELAGERSFRALLEKLARDTVPALAPPPPYRPIVTKGKPSTETLVQMLSDFHAYETVKPSRVRDFNAYNAAIFGQRARGIVENHIAIKTKLEAGGGWRFPELVIALNGDLISGTIHELERHSDAPNVVLATYGAAMVLAQMVRDLAANYERVRIYCTSGNHGRLPDARRTASTDRWLKAVARAEEKRGKSFKLRKLIKGLSSLEITYNAKDTTWHAHRHLIVSMPYMPHVIMGELWNIATEGKGQIVDVRAIKDVETGVMEAIKYVTKGWEIPDTGKNLFGKPSPQEELLAALKGKKRTWAIGRIKPQEEPKVCAGCGKEECTCERIATVSMTDKVEDGGFDVPNPTGTPERLYVYRDEKNRLTWRMLRGEDVLSLYRAKYQVKECTNSVHDPPTYRSVYTSPDLTITLPTTDYEFHKEAEAAQPSQITLKL